MRQEAPILLELLFSTKINEPQVLRVLRIPLKSWVRKKEAWGWGHGLGGHICTLSP